MKTYWPIKHQKSGTVKIVASDTGAPEVGPGEQRAGPGRVDFERVKAEWPDAVCIGSQEARLRLGHSLNMRAKCITNDIRESNWIAAFDNAERLVEMLRPHADKMEQQYFEDFRGVDEKV